MQKKKRQEGKKKAHHYVAKCASTSVHTSGSLFICEKKGDGGVYPWFLLSTAVLQLLEVSKDQSRRRCWKTTGKVRQKEGESGKEW